MMLVLVQMSAGGSGLYTIQEAWCVMMCAYMPQDTWSYGGCLCSCVLCGVCKGLKLDLRDCNGLYSVSQLWLQLCTFSPSYGLLLPYSLTLRTRARCIQSMHFTGACVGIHWAESEAAQVAFVCPHTVYLVPLDKESGHQQWSLPSPTEQNCTAVVDCGCVPTPYRVHSTAPVSFFNPRSAFFCTLPFVQHIAFRTLHNAQCALYAPYRRRYTAPSAPRAFCTAYCAVPASPPPPLRKHGLVQSRGPRLTVVFLVFTDHRFCGQKCNFLHNFRLPLHCCETASSLPVFDMQQASVCMSNHGTVSSV